MSTRLGDGVFTGFEIGVGIGGDAGIVSLKREPHFQQKTSPSELRVPHLVQYINFASLMATTTQCPRLRFYIWNQLKILNYLAANVA